jgi:hypothetical protein
LVVSKQECHEWGAPTLLPITASRSHGDVEGKLTRMGAHHLSEVVCIIR